LQEALKNRLLISSLKERKNMNNERKTVKQNLGGRLHDLEGTIDNAIQYLLKIKEKYPDYKNLRLEVDYEDGSTCLILVYDREETDFEYNQRIARDQLREKQERDQYLRLKAKFENQTTKETK
jgi:wobble nucleotide-excising tRNase